MNLFNNDMSIPILNFLNQNNLKLNYYDKYFIKTFNQFNFYDVKNSQFPIYRYFKNMDKTNINNIIKFNVGNEFAVNLFRYSKIKYTDIYKFIKIIGSLNLKSKLNNIKDIINYHEELELYIRKDFNIKF